MFNDEKIPVRKPLPIKMINISNIMGIENCKIEPGRITVIKGQNGEGKTSAMNAILSVIGGTKVQLLRDGQKQAEVAIELHDETLLEKKITEKSSSVKVSNKFGSAMKSPQAYINKLLNRTGANPLSILSAPKTSNKTTKSRADILLDAIPLELDRAKLDKILENLDVEDIEEIDYKQHPVYVLQDVEQKLIEERKVVNKEKKNKEGSINEDSDRLSELDVDPVEVKQKLAELDKQFQENISFRDKSNDELHSKESSELEKIETENREKVQELNNRIRAIELEIAELNRVKSEKREEIKKNYAGKQKELIENHATKQTELSNEKAKYEEKHDRIKHFEQIRQRIADNQETANTLQKVADEYSRAIKEIDTLKHDLQKDLPIEGVRIVDGDIQYNNIDWNNLNTAKKMQLCVELADLQSGDLKLAILDGIERLDSNSQDALFRYADKKGLQLICTEVTDDTELVIENVELEESEIAG
jgi:energy-coupling factor transporter ATP-binding protein EcfA2